MLSLETAEAAPTWLPDLFAWLYLRLRRDATRIFSEGWLAFCGEHDAAVINTLHQAIQKSTDGTAPAELLLFLDGKGDDTVVKSSLARTLVAALAIDQAFAELRRDVLKATGAPPLPPGVKAVREQYLIEGNCAKDANYLVLPAEPPVPSDTSPSGDSVRLLFKYLRALVIGDLPTPWKVIPARSIKRRSFNAAVHRDMGDLDHLRVAVVPLAQTAADATLRELDFRGESRVEITLSDEQEGRLALRAIRAIQRAADDGAHIVVMPEWIVSVGVSRAIQEALRALGEQAQDRLQLVVAGTGLTTDVAIGFGLPYSECIVYSGFGDVLWRQRKMHHWVMHESCQTAAGLVPVVGGRREHFHSHDTLVVADTPIGRCVVLICEDVQQEIPARRVLDALSPRWVFVPVFDTPLGVGRWSAEKAKDIASAFGTSVVVVNSLVLPPPATAAAVSRGFGWLVSRVNPNSFMAAQFDPSVPLDLSSPPVVGQIGWDIKTAFDRLVLFKPRNTKI